MSEAWAECPNLEHSTLLLSGKADSYCSAPVSGSVQPRGRGVEDQGDLQRRGDLPEAGGQALLEGRVSGSSLLRGVYLPKIEYICPTPFIRK